MTISAFLAFEPADADAVRAVRAELERNGLSVEQSDPAERTDAKAPALMQRIAEARVVAVFASPAAEESPWLRREVYAALSNARSVVVVQTADLAPDSWLTGALAFEDSIDLRGGVHSEALSKIVSRAQTSTGGGRVVAMLNMKGGVGKTVLAANLFAAAHLADKRSVSYVDLDPQHNLTQYFLAPAERQTLREQELTLHRLLTAPRPGDFASFATPLNRPKHPKATPPFELVSGDERLFEFTLDLRNEREKAQAFARFRALVAWLRTRADAVVIDTAPCATFLTRMAISCADHIVAPVRSEKYAIAGLNMIEQLVREVRQRPLRPAEFSVLLNGVSESGAGRADAFMRDELHHAPFFAAAVLPAEIPYSSMLKSPPTDRAASNPISITAMMRLGGRAAKEALTSAAAMILRRAGS